MIHQHAIPPIAMGPTRHFDLARKIIAQGHEVIVFAGNYCHTQFHYIADPYHKINKLAYYANVPFFWIEVPAYHNNSVKRLWNMLVFAYKLVRNKNLKFIPKPDVIIGSSPSPFAAFAAKKLAEQYNVPFIYEIRDIWPATLLSLGNFSKYHPLIQILQHIEDDLLKAAKKIIGVLPGIGDYLQQQKISRDKFLWLPNAIDIKEGYDKQQAYSDQLIILYAGSFNISNDLETLLKAAKLLQNYDSQKFRIQLIGDGPQKSRLHQIVSAEKINNVEFLPAVKKECIGDIVASADICVGMVKKTKLYQWGTSLNKITDYLAMAKPIVFALDSPYNPILEAKAGLTVEPENPDKLAEAIIKIASLSWDERQKLGQNGRNYARQYFNLDKTAITLVEQLLD
jgi:glycosyltransferase involved in cell wall biosynthesis